MGSLNFRVLSGANKAIFQTTMQSNQSACLEQARWNLSWYVGILLPSWVPKYASASQNARESLIPTARGVSKPASFRLGVQLHPKL